MAKKKAKSKPVKSAKPAQATKRSSPVKDHASTAFSLFSAFKEEGLSSAIQFLSMAGAVATEARKNLRPEMVFPQLKEVVSSLGFAYRSDVEKLESRLEELEERLSRAEYSALRDEEE
jgi:hypothetical protein